MGDALTNIGIILLLFSLIAIATGVLLLLISLAVSKLRRAGLYILLGGAVSLLASFALCSAGGINI